MLTPFAAYSVFVTTKLHFQGKIDVKTRGLFLHTLTEHSLNKRTDRWAFVSLARKWDDPVALSTYLAAEWAVHGPPSWSGQVIESANTYQGAQVRRNKVLAAPEVYIKEAVNRAAVQCSMNRFVSGLEPQFFMNIARTNPEVAVILNRSTNGAILKGVALSSREPYRIDLVERYSGFVPVMPSVLKYTSDLLAEHASADASAEADMKDSVKDIENAQMTEMLKGLI